MADLDGAGEVDALLADAESLNNASQGDGVDSGHADDAEQSLNGAAAGAEDRGPVPYERFREVNERAKLADEYEPWKDAVTLFKENGINNGAELRAFLEKQQTEAKTAQELSQYEQTEYQRLKKLVDADQISQDVAATIFEQQIAARKEQLTSQTMLQSLQRKQSDFEFSSVKASFPKMDEDTVRTVLAANPGMDVRKLAEASHNRTVSIEERAIADYNAGKTKVRQRPAPEGGGGSAVPRAGGMPDPIEKPKEFDAWYKSQLQATNSKYL